MEYIENKISDLLKEIEKLIKNKEYKEIENKRKDLDKLLNEYLKNFK